MFEKASRKKLRFKHTKGMISVEELWDLPLKPDLDNLAKASYQKLQSSVKSFVDKRKPRENADEQLRLDLLKHVIGVKIDEIENAEKLAAKKAQKERILDIIEEKEDEKLASKSVSELKKMIKKL